MRYEGRHAFEDLPCRFGAGDVNLEPEFAVAVEHRHVAARGH
jgi:hypothetical protein